MKNEVLKRILEKRSTQVEKVLEVIEKTEQTKKKE